MRWGARLAAERYAGTRCASAGALGAAQYVRKLSAEKLFSTCWTNAVEMGTDSCMCTGAADYALHQPRHTAER